MPHSALHCKNESVCGTPKCFYMHTILVFGVRIEIFWCAHTFVFTVYRLVKPGYAIDLLHSMHQEKNSFVYVYSSTAFIAV